MSSVRCLELHPRVAERARQRNGAVRTDPPNYTSVWRGLRHQRPSQRRRRNPTAALVALAGVLAVEGALIPSLACSRANHLTVRNRLEATAERRDLHLAFRRSSGRIVRFAIEAAPPASAPVDQPPTPVTPKSEPETTPAPKKRGRNPTAATV